MTDITETKDAKRVRIDLIDILRGVALIAMAIYHFTWDLDFHGFVDRGTATEGGWRLFARGIASSFLFLVGIGLVLAHARGIRWRPFLRREAQVAAGAAAITAVTIMVTPDSFVFFGILHQIALGSLIGLLFLRLPAAVTAVSGLAVIALPFAYETQWTEPRWLAWIGMAAKDPFTNDYVPIFPWTGVILLGIAAANALDSAGLWRRIALLNGRVRRLRPLGWLGRHSLLFYLLHQPLLFGLVAGAAVLYPPDQTALFESSCRRECLKRTDADTCDAYCDCVESRLKADDLLGRLLAGRTTEEEDGIVRRTVLQCSFAERPATP